MKILHTSDWHIGRYLYDYSLLEDQEYILNEIFDIAVNNCVDAVVISGDLFDRSVPSSPAVSVLDDFFYRLVQNGIKVLAVCGNHDGRQRMGFLSRMCTNSGIYLVNEFNTENCLASFSDEFGKINFYFVPYLEPTDLNDNEIKTFNDAFKKAVEIISENFDENERNIIVAHGFFAGVSDSGENDVIFSESEISVGPADMISADYLKKFDYAALGHLHRAQHTGEKYIRYSGSPLKYAVEDTSEKSVAIVDIRQKGDISIDTVKLHPKRDIKTVRGSFEDVLNPLPGTEYLNDYIFAVITDDFVIPNAMAQLKNVYPNILGMRIVSRENEQNAVLNINSELLKTDMLTLFGEFYSALKDSPLDGERLKIAQDAVDTVEKGRCDD